MNPASEFPERFTVSGPGWLVGRQGGEPTKLQLKKTGQLPGKALFVVHFEGVDSLYAAEMLERRAAEDSYSPTPT